MVENAEISLYEYWLVLKRHQRLIQVVWLGTFIISAFFVLLSPNIYEAQTTFYYPLGGSVHSSGGSPFAESFLGNQGSAIGSLFSTSEGTLQDYTRGILSSRKISDDVIDRLHLADRFHARPSDLEGMLHGMTQFKLTQDGVMEITVSATEPKLAAEIANAYVDAFRDYSLSSMITIAKKHRIDVEKRLAQLKEKLKEAEADMSDFQRTHKILDSKDKGAVVSSSLSELEVSRAGTQIALNTALGAIRQTEQARIGQLYQASRNPLVSPKEVNPVLDGLRERLAVLYVQESQAKVTETPANPERRSIEAQIRNLEKAMRQEIRHEILNQAHGTSDDLFSREVKAGELQARLSAIQQGIVQAKKSFDAFPKENMEYQQKARKLKVLETLYLFLSSEYEKARLEEAKESPDFQVLDAAIVPTHKSKPNRLSGLMLGLGLGLFLGVLSAFLVESISAPAKTPIPPDGRLKESEFEFADRTKG